MTPTTLTGTVAKPKMLAAAVRCAGLLALSFTLIACSQASDEELLERARTAMQQGDARTAEIDTRTALQQNPDNPDARYLLGEAYLFQQNAVAAADELQRSLDAREDPEVRLLYARALLAANRGEQLLTRHAANEFVSIGDDPRYLAVLATTQAAAGQLQTARESLAAAMAEAPDDPQVATTNALFLLVYSNRADDALTAIQRTTEQHPDYADAWSLLGSIHQMRGEYADAESSYEKVVQLNTYRFTDRLNLITVRIDQGKTEQARTALDRLLSSNPNHPGVNYLHGRMLLEAGNNVDALTALGRVLSVDPAHVPSLYAAAAANISEGNLATAESQLDRLLGAQRDHVPGHLMLANLYLRMGNPAEAEQAARGLLQDNPLNFPAMTVLATALTAQGEGNSSESMELYQRMIEASPAAIEPRLALAAALLQGGDSEGALAQLISARDLAPNAPQPQESLIQTYLVVGDIASAKSAAAAYALQQPDSPRPAIFLARIALQENDVSGANEYFGQSEEMLRQALAADPDNLGIQGFLVDTLMSQGKLEDAGAILAALPAELATNPSILVARGRIALAGGRATDAEQFLREAMDSSPNSVTLMLLGGSMKAQNRMDDATGLLEDWLTSNPTDVLVHFELASTYMQMGNEQDATEHYQAIVDNGAENVIALNNLAWLIRESNPRQALQYIQRADELAPNSPAIIDTYAMIQLALGATNEALALNQRAVDGAPTEPGLIYNRAIILHAAGQTSQAIRTLEELAAMEGMSSARIEEVQTLLEELRGL